MNQSTPRDAGLASFSRPRYFYGQLLDVHHFDSEQRYFIDKIHMLNRMVSGYGVVCGLDVQLDGDGVKVMPGLALDRRGREIVVPVDSRTIRVDPAPAADGAERYEPHCDPDEWARLVICYKECPGEPEPSLGGGDCGEPAPCSPGSTLERYELRLEPGKAEPIDMDCQIPDLIKGNRINYRALVDWVSSPCDEFESGCLTLANIRRPAAGGKLDSADIDISVRPVVFSLDLLFELMLALTQETHSRRSGKN